MAERFSSSAPLGQPTREASPGSGGVQRGHVGERLRPDDGSGELISTVWHLLWRGALDIDMTAPWTLTTAVALHIRHTGD